LSSASDLISTELIKFLVEDQEWLQALFITRTGLVDMGDRIIPLQKFSAMGNGYTWELQSAVFYSMIRACNEYLGVDDHVCSIFGDDIICHKDVAPTLIYFLAACGLKINTKKSYTSGYFRESCGKHYYKGLDVSPFYLRKPLKANSDIVVLHNRIFAWATEFGYKDASFKDLLQYLRSVVTCKVLYVPKGYGDGAFHACRSDLPFKLKTHVEKSRNKPNIGGFIVDYYHVAKSVLSKPGQTALDKWLFGYKSETQTASDIPFGNLYADVASLHIREWHCFGPWIPTVLP
jgi:hypothetical protein